MSLEVQLAIGNEWYENSIPSVDCRNGRESVSIRKSIYHQRYSKDLQHEQPLLEKKKRNPTYYNSTRRIVTCTSEKIRTILAEKHGLSVASGTVWAYKPFYVTNPSEKEKQLCLCNCA